MGNNFFKYLNTGPIEEKWGIYVTTVGYSKVTPNERYPKEEHPQSHQLTWNRGRILTDYYMIFISKGKGTCCSALTEPVEIEEGTCFFLFPGVWHRYRPDIRSGWEEYWVGFHGYYVDQLMKQGFFDPNRPCIKTGLDRDMLVLFKKMIDVVNASLVGYSQQIAGLTLQILGLVNTISLSKQYDHSPLEKAIMKAKFLLQESLEQPVDIPELARQLPMGYSAFRKNFKAVTGLSPNQYHLNLRIERAKELLESTLLNVEEIADQTGFDSIYYFSRIFKKKVGLSPNTYRKTFAVE
ncbi:helix-turn-helix domain-containing protein [Chitinophaga sp. ARDCPP14]|uniref:helix-turn-helix domain-containing protein n=1 Tax=Chitinophaga sp. ARDCPP14 TaxID=3391139 RepID=UPI003F52841D